MIDLNDFSRKLKTLSGGSKQKTCLMEKNGELFIRKTIKKRDSRKTRNQIRWFIKNEGAHVPPIKNYGERIFDFHYDLPYFEGYKSLSEFVIEESLEKSKKMLRKILAFLFNDFYVYKEDPEIENKLDHYLESRLIERLRDICHLNKEVAELSKYHELIINDKKYPSALELINRILAIKHKIAEKSKKSVLNLHGDLIADNILCKEEDFILLDPDESPFGSYLGDMGKLFESFHSRYEIMLQNKDFEIKGNKINFPEPQNDNYKAIFEFLREELKKYVPEDQFPLIIFNEALHFSRMLPYKHHNNPKIVPIYYCQTIRLLNMFLQLFEV